MPKPTPKRSRKGAPRIAATARVAITGADAPTAEQPARFRMTAYTGEPMRIYSWADPVVVDLETADVGDQRIPALYDHWADMGSVVGQVDRLAIEGQHLVAEGQFTIPPADPARGQSCGERVLALARSGYQWQASVGADPSSTEEIKAGAVGVANWGRKYPGPCVIGRGCRFRELSFVVLGGDRRTSVVTARIKGAAMTFEQWLLAMGFDDPAALSEVQRANLQLKFNEEYPEDAAADPGAEEAPTAAADDPTPEEKVNAATDDDPAAEEKPPTNAAAKPPAVRAAKATPDPVAQFRREMAAEERRVADVRRICAAADNPEIEVTVGGRKKKVGLQAHAVEQGWTAQRTELQALRLSRGSGPSVVVKAHDKDCTLQALQGAMILRAGGKLDAPAYKTQKAVALKIPTWLRAGINDADRNRIMEASHHYSDMSAVDLCREACRLDGKTPGHGREATIQAAFSGSALTNIFTTNVNAILLSSYLEAPDTTAGWTTEADVADFKTQERPRVQVGPGLAKLPRGGTADHANYSDTAETYKIARYSKQFVVDEQDIIDDSLGALSDVPQKFGMAAARLRPDLVYAVLLANGTLADGVALFSAAAGRGNLGTSSALTAANLKTAIAAMQNMQENSVNLNLTPTHLIVPPSLRFTAKELIASAAIVIAGTAGGVTERGSANTLADENLQMVSDSRLENGVTDPSSGTAYGGSATTWFLASVMAHLIEVAYLRGTGRAPRVRSGMLDKGRYGMWWDVSMDIGAKALDYKGLRKTTA